MDANARAEDEGIALSLMMRVRWWVLGLALLVAAVAGAALVALARDRRLRAWEHRVASVLATSDSLRAVAHRAVTAADHAVQTADSAEAVARQADQQAVRYRQATLAARQVAESLGAVLDTVTTLADSARVLLRQRQRLLEERSAWEVERTSLLDAFRAQMAAGTALRLAADTLRRQVARDSVRIAGLEATLGAYPGRLPDSWFGLHPSRAMLAAGCLGVGYAAAELRRGVGYAVAATACLGPLAVRLLGRALGL